MSVQTAEQVIERRVLVHNCLVRLYSGDPNAKLTVAGRNVLLAATGEQIKDALTIALQS